MRPIRSAVGAFAATGALVFGLAGVAGAQVPYDTTIDAECDTTTGTYVIRVTLDNNVDEEAVLGYLGWDAFDADGPTDSGNEDFSPNPMPALGASSASVVVPGDTVLVEFAIGAEYTQFVYDTTPSIELDGDCETAATTITSPSTTSTEPAPAVVTRPRFTG